MLYTKHRCKAPEAAGIECNLKAFATKQMA